AARRARLGQRERDPQRNVGALCRCRQGDLCKLRGNGGGAGGGGFARARRFRKLVRRQISTAVLDLVRAIYSGAAACRTLVPQPAQLNSTIGWRPWSCATASSPSWSF